MMRHKKIRSIRKRNRPYTWWTEFPPLRGWRWGYHPLKGFTAFRTNDMPDPDDDSKYQGLDFSARMPIPEGRYMVDIIGWNAHQTSNYKSYAGLELRIADGPFANERLRYNIYTREVLGRLCQTLQVPYTQMDDVSVVLTKLAHQPSIPSHLQSIRCFVTVYWQTIPNHTDTIFLGVRDFSLDDPTYRLRPPYTEASPT